MNTFDHPHMMSLLDTIERRDRMFLVMPMVTGGDLFNHISPGQGAPVETAKFWFAQLVHVVEHMHKFGWAHMDIKPDNILLESDGIRLTDFGQARQIRGDIAATYGTKTYAAPEVFYTRAFRTWYDAQDVFDDFGVVSEEEGVNPAADPRQLDVWALGCTLYVMLTGCFPFPGATQQKLMENVLFRTPKHRPQIPSEAMDLIMRMLEKSPEKRASIDEIKNSTWLKDTYTIVKEQVDAAKASVGQVPVRPVCGAKLDVPVRRSSLAPIVAVRGERENAECPIGEEVAPRDRSKFSLGAVMKWIRNRF